MPHDVSAVAEQQHGYAEKVKTFAASPVFHSHLHVLTDLQQQGIARQLIGNFGLQAEIWQHPHNSEKYCLRLTNPCARARSVYPFSLPIALKGETLLTNAEGYIAFPKYQLIDYIKAMQPLGNHPTVVSVWRECHSQQPRSR